MPIPADHAADARDIVRFLACGSVDDGKSALLGRLLYDAGLVPEDQWAFVLRESARLDKTGGDGEHMRVFPLSNWTELDIWRYVRREAIPVVHLYFPKERPVIARAGTLVMVDDERLKPAPGERVEQRRVRFRTLGCYPLTGAIESEADTLDAIIAEMQRSRQGRIIDADEVGSMEKKKREGYF